MEQGRMRKNKRRKELSSVNGMKTCSDDEYDKNKPNTQRKRNRVNKEN